MAVKHTGNVQPQLDMEEHYGTLDAKRVVLINKDDGAPYNADLSAEVDDVSLASISSGANWIGLTSISGDVDLNTGGNWVGLASVSGTVGLNTGSDYIGLATVDIGTIKAWADPGTYIGLASVNVAGTVTVDATGQGDVPITLDSEEVVLSTGANYVGLASVNISPIPAGTAGIGFATVATPDQEYTPTYTSGPTTDWIVKASAGFLHAIKVGAAVGSGVIEVSDHASDGDGNIKFYLSGDTLGPAVYPVNAKMTSGITADITTQTHVTLLWR